MQPLRRGARPGRDERVFHVTNSGLRETMRQSLEQRASCQVVPTYYLSFANLGGMGLLPVSAQYSVSKAWKQCSGRQTPSSAESRPDAGGFGGTRVAVAIEMLLRAPSQRETVREQAAAPDGKRKRWVSSRCEA